MHKDRGTGQVVSDGRVGDFLLWVRFWAPFLSLLLIPLFLWSLDHRSQHDAMNEFMKVGPRFTGTTEYPNATTLKTAIAAEYRAELAQALSELPPREYQKRIDEALAEIREDVRWLRENR